MIDSYHFEENGYALTPVLFKDLELERLIQAIEELTHSVSTRGGVRDVMQHIPELRAVAEDGRVRDVVDTVLGSQAFVVRATLFDKNENANWKVPWHQDVTIAVDRRVEMKGYGPWSMKEGVQHVQPPSDVLQKMVTVRVHLDACPAINGALRVMPGTHHLGRLDQNNVAPYVSDADSICCEAAAGAALVMRPLLLHSSSASLQPKHRRVLHFDFAGCDLAGGMAWKLRA